MRRVAIAHVAKKTNDTALARNRKATDRVFIYYSGHGSRAAFKRRDGSTFHREALVPVDVHDDPADRLLYDHELNRFLGELRSQRPGPARNGRRLNLLYGTQVETRPPRFRLFVNDPALVTRDWAYWVENRVRDRFGLAGVPVVIDFVRRG